MSKVDLQFGDVIVNHDPGFISWRIRSKTNGWANHASMVVDPHHSVQATFKPGVHFVRSDELLRGRGYVILRPYHPESKKFHTFPPENQKVCTGWLHEQLGTNYDFGSIAGFLTGVSTSNIWNNPNAWFCSELVTAALAKAGFKVFNELKDLAFVSPTDIGSVACLKPLEWKLPEKVLQRLGLDGGIQP